LRHNCNKTLFVFWRKKQLASVIETEKDECQVTGVSRGWRCIVLVLGFNVQDDDKGEDKSSVDTRLHHNIVFVISSEYIR
jgi:hypothetical protein